MLGWDAMDGNGRTKLFLFSYFLQLFLSSSYFSPPVMAPSCRPRKGVKRSRPHPESYTRKVVGWRLSVHRRNPRNFFHCLFQVIQQIGDAKQASDKEATIILKDAKNKLALKKWIMHNMGCLSSDFSINIKEEVAATQLIATTQPRSQEEVAKYHGAMQNTSLVVKLHSLINNGREARVKSQYKLENEIGKGSFGKAFYARSLSDSSVVVIKMLHSQIDMKPDALAKATMEIAFMEMLKKYIPTS